jgi:hypothetical protein
LLRLQLDWNFLFLPHDQRKRYRQDHGRRFMRKQPAGALKLTLN